MPSQNHSHAFFQSVAAAEGWTPTTQVAVLLDYIAKQDRYIVGHVSPQTCYEAFVDYINERLESERQDAEDAAEDDPQGELA